ncbi:hypothetical protein [Paracoccus solventivorans]|uniref:hypothetical protein n=1 Tax=Paracoccus solventivorans TaxID=53463 RepID=UPI0026F14ECF|nr:hypothetical protein [Paracoccus solventivorans]
MSGRRGIKALMSQRQELAAKVLLAMLQGYLKSERSPTAALGHPCGWARAERALAAKVGDKRDVLLALQIC